MPRNLDMTNYSKQEMKGNKSQNMDHSPAEAGSAAA